MTVICSKKVEGQLRINLSKLHPYCYSTSRVVSFFCCKTRGDTLCSIYANCFFTNFGGNFPSVKISQCGPTL